MVCLPGIDIDGIAVSNRDEGELVAGAVETGVADEAGGNVDIASVAGCIVKPTG